MGISRISSTFLTNDTLFNLHNSMGALGRLQGQISSGRRIQSASDDPLGLTRLLNVKLDTSMDEQHLKNIEDARSEMEAVDQTLISLVNIGTRAQELATRASTITNGPTQLQAMANDLDSLVRQALQLGNTSHTGRRPWASACSSRQRFDLYHDQTEAGSASRSPRL
jgi:flagellar hook-associated protein 3 FlgL